MDAVQHGCVGDAAQHALQLRRDDQSAAGVAQAGQLFEDANTPAGPSQLLRRLQAG